MHRPLLGPLSTDTPNTKPDHARRHILLQQLQQPRPITREGASTYRERPSAYRKRPTRGRTLRPRTYGALTQIRMGWWPLTACHLVSTSLSARAGTTLPADLYAATHLRCRLVRWARWRPVDHGCARCCPRPRCIGCKDRGHNGHINPLQETPSFHCQSTYHRPSADVSLTILRTNPPPSASSARATRQDGLEL